MAEFYHENVKSTLDILFYFAENLLSTFSSYAPSFYQMKNLETLICHWIQKLMVKKFSCNCPFREMNFKTRKVERKWKLFVGDENIERKRYG
jgi:hypothetical protein